MIITNEIIKTKSLEELIDMQNIECECGRIHEAKVAHVYIESGAVNRLPELINECGSKKPFLLSGHDTFEAAGKYVTEVLEKNGIEYSKYVFEKSPVLPTEWSVGSAVMHFDYSCDLIIGIGSGVINDIGKIIARMTGKTYIIVGTAPSMDGFVSATSSMERDGLKVSLDSKAAWAVIGDLDILCKAPMNMIVAGVGDMIAKYISLVEWKIAHIIVGEYCCPVIVSLVEMALNKIVSSAKGLKNRDPEAVKTVMDGLNIGGIAMNYAKMSRPLSGVEHYFSHIWDMRSLAFDDAKADLHGIQCGIATLYSLKVYEYIKTIKPDYDTAVKYCENFDIDRWNENLVSFIGEGAKSMIESEKKEGKYRTAGQKERIKTIIDKCDEIIEIINTLPSYNEVKALMEEIGSPTDAKYLGYTNEMLGEVFMMTKDIRFKYISSNLLWDTGMLDECVKSVFGE